MTPASLSIILYLQLTIIVCLLALVFKYYKKHQSLISKLLTKDHKLSDLKLRVDNLSSKAENLETQLRLKNIELTKQIKDGEDKGRVLDLLRNKLNEAEYNPKVNKKYWAEMDRVLSIHLEKNQDTFEMQIDDLHQDFINRVHKLYPVLSVYELRLCTYLKIGMNSKEIADLLMVLPSSVNVSRSRLRKKLKLKTSEDLFSFLNEL